MNARISSQFWPLVQARRRTGRPTRPSSSSRCGDDPGWETGRPSGVARLATACASSRTRTSDRCPDPEDGLELLVRPGLRLSRAGAQRRAELPPLHLRRVRRDARRQPWPVAAPARSVSRRGFELEPVAPAHRRDAARLRDPLRLRSRPVDRVLPRRPRAAVPFANESYAEFATEGAKFSLYARSRLPELIGRDAPAGRAPWPHGEVAFFCDDVDGEHRRLVAAGVTVLAPPTDRPWGERTLHVEDPDGYVVELTKPRAS